MHSIVIYFSKAGSNYANGKIVDLEVGNTEVAAKMIAELTGAELFKVEPVTPYPDDYLSCTRAAQADLAAHIRPAVKALPDVSDVDIVYFGYPNYWRTMPAFMFTVLEKLDLANKTIKPFCTHEGSGLGNSEADIRKLQPSAKLEAGLAIHGADVADSLELIKNWV